MEEMKSLICLLTVLLMELVTNLYIFELKMNYLSVFNYYYQKKRFRINLRPLRRTLRDFKSFEIFLNQVFIDQKNLNSYYKEKFQIRNKGSDAFFKPFARDSKGHYDPVFPIDDTEISVQSNWLPSHHKLNLTTALKYLINNFN